MERKTVLFVDDDDNFLAYVKSSLRDTDHRVLTVSDGNEALCLIDSGDSVDLIVTDHVMPGMDGLELMAAVRERLRSVPMILLTAHASIETFFRAFKLGAYEVTNKPIGRRVLRAIVKSALARTARDGTADDTPQSRSGEGST